MLQPKRTKFRKQMKGHNRGLAQSGNTVAFGEFGLKSTGRGRITARQIEAARRAMTRHIKRGGKIWIRIFPDKPITKKPLEVRQGKGKGSGKDESAGNKSYWSGPRDMNVDFFEECLRGRNHTRVIEPVCGLDFAQLFVYHACTLVHHPGLPTQHLVGVIVTL